VSALSGPLFGSEVVVTRPAESARALSDSLRALGAEVIEAPLIERGPPPDPEALKASLRALSTRAERGELTQAWLIFTSAYAARVSSEALSSASESGDEALRRLVERGLKVACVGDKTARELQRRGVEVAVSPKRSIAEGLLEALQIESGGLAGLNITFPRALKAREWLVDELRAQGAQVELVYAYQTSPRELSDEQKATLSAAPQEGKRRILTLTSDSSAASLLAQWGSYEEGGWRAALSHAQLCVIGPTVARYLSERGIKVERVAEPHNTEGMRRALVEMMRER